MKKVFLTLTMLLFAFFGTMKAGVVVEIGAGYATSTTSYYPTNAYYNYSIAQEIFTGSEIGLNGEITKFGFNVKANSATRNLKIFMKEVSYDEFASTSAWETFTASEKYHTLKNGASYTMDDLDKLIVNMNYHLENENLDDLYAAGLINIDDPEKLNRMVPSQEDPSVNVRIGTFTITEALNYSLSLIH